MQSNFTIQFENGATASGTYQWRSSPSVRQLHMFNHGIEDLLVFGKGYLRNTNKNEEWEDEGEANDNLHCCKSYR